MSIRLKNLYSTYESLIGKSVSLKGWVMSVRQQKEITFIKLNDGSNPGGVQLVNEGREIPPLAMGMSLAVTGTVVVSPSPQQPFEIHVTELIILGTLLDDNYPLSKGKLPFDYLRKHAHFRARTSTFGSVFRIKSAISHATHEFFRDSGFLHLNPNIITSNDCEGNSSVFYVTEHSLSEHSNLPVIDETDKTNQHVCSLSDKHDWTKDHFDKPVSLTVSSQLSLEALACSLGPVYTDNKSFRAEHSNTHKHLSEFQHLEIELPFTSLTELMDIAEGYVKSVGQYLFRHAGEDIDNLSKFISKGLRERVEAVVSLPFIRITYDDAITLLKNAKGLKNKVEYGEDLCSEFENYLTSHYGRAVFVYHWPSSIKSFYMKQIPLDSKNVQKCENFDLLMPYGVGELVGASMREDDLDTLLNVMSKKGVSPDNLPFYLDLRRYGKCQNGGWGLGLDRLCMLFTGMENIKDCVPFTVSYKNCNY